MEIPMMLAPSGAPGAPPSRLATLLIACSFVALAGCSSTSPTSPSGPVTLLVDPAGGGDHTTIQAALNEASGGDTVLVVPGTYTGAQNRDLDFGGQNIVLKAAAARDSVVIDCEGQGRGFYLHGGEGRSAVIDGFVVVNGHANRGGGAFFDGASPTVRNAVFRGNSAVIEGGGVHCRGSSPSLADVAFRANSAATGTGGGLFCQSGSPSLADVTFTENEAGSGAGMTCILADATLHEVVFVRNEAGTAGGGLYCGSSSPTIDEVTFVANRAFIGGAIGLSGASPSISHATIANNEATSGGGIYCGNSSAPTIEKSVIAFNLGGGSVYCAGANAPYTTESCLYGNFGGDTPCGTHEDNIYEDPLFCDLGGDDVKLCANSPCLPAGNDWGLRLGDKGQGCGDCASSLSGSRRRALLGGPRP
ncbi:MAG: right-handed parallel beta-helix repeat-containing protein [Candidatus Eisenbacteria bacterium]